MHSLKAHIYVRMWPLHGLYKLCSKFNIQESKAKWQASGINRSYLNLILLIKFIMPLISGRVGRC